MKINKSLNIDLNIISPQKHIRIHEGDVDSVDILIGVSVDDEAVDLDGVTIKYDATINNYLAEQDADGSVVDDKISIPVTQNMTAMSGLLLIDVRMIQNDQILFTQTICATVEKAVVNGSTYIDFDKITIIQRMNALEEKMEYIEELVENFDTSKLIISVNRPPEGAPVEVDVDLLRVGDTWILSGNNIVYKLVKAQYNYSPAPGVEPRHSFTWQPLNERYGVGNTEPPTTKTYQQIVYTINEVQWSWLPVPKYFKGDHYQMLVDGESTYYICVSGNMADTGVYTYTWREEGGGASSGITIINTETVPESAEWGDSIPASYAGNTGKAGELAYWEEDGYFWGLCSLATDPITGNINYNWVRQADEIDIDDLKSNIATKMKLAPLNPTAKQIEDMPNGQLYGDDNSHKGIIKDGQEFYDTFFVNDRLIRKITNERGYTRPPAYIPIDSSVNDILRIGNDLFRGGDYGGVWYLQQGTSYVTVDGELTHYYRWKRLSPLRHINNQSLPPELEPFEVFNYYYLDGILIEKVWLSPKYQEGDYYYYNGERYICSSAECEFRFVDGVQKGVYVYNWIPITVPTKISAFTNDSGYLTLETLPIYDGTVI